MLAKMESLNPGGSLKDRPVLRMLLSALDDGRLAAKSVLGSSSVIPDNASNERKKRLVAHGQPRPLLLQRPVRQRGQLARPLRDDGGGDSRAVARHRLGRAPIRSLTW